MKKKFYRKFIRICIILHFLHELCPKSDVGSPNCKSKVTTISKELKGARLQLTDKLQCVTSEGTYMTKCLKIAGL
jgi:hypothetical protein